MLWISVYCGLLTRALKALSITFGPSSGLDKPDTKVSKVLTLPVHLPLIGCPIFPITNRTT